MDRPMCTYGNDQSCLSAESGVELTFDVYFFIYNTFWNKSQNGQCRAMKTIYWFNCSKGIFFSIFLDGALGRVYKCQYSDLRAYVNQKREWYCIKFSKSLIDSSR